MFSNEIENEKFKKIIDFFSDVGSIQYENWNDFTNSVNELSADEKESLFNFMIFSSSNLSTSQNTAFIV